jgi:hypothetical protein
MYKKENKDIEKDSAIHIKWIWTIIDHPFLDRYLQALQSSFDGQTF